MKIVTILGVRPNIIKLGPLMKRINKTKIEQVIINTGQHYDYEMSKTFFDKLKIPKPHYNLEIGSGSQAHQTAESLKGIERILVKERPNYVIVIGDANPTLAGALAAKKLHIPVIHIEAGLRSNDMDMPEEINRVIVDNISDYLITPTDYATENLKKEGIPKEKIFQFGDITVDAIQDSLKIANKSNILKKLKIKKPFILSTIHRAENTDVLTNLKQIMEALNSLDNVVFPIHPRTKKILEENNLKYDNINFIEPLDYLSFLKLMKESNLIISDSGGIQKESLILKIPCINPRNSYEWKYTVKLGQTVLTGPNKNKIIKEAKKRMNHKAKLKNLKNPYGKKVSEKIIQLLK